MESTTTLTCKFWKSDSITEKKLVVRTLHFSTNFRDLHEREFLHNFGVGLS